MAYPEININELIAKLDSEEFYKEYGNPVRCKIFDTDKILLSFDLYERVFGKVDIDKENTIEMDDFIRALVLQRSDDNPVRVTDTEDGYSLSMETEVYDYLARIAMKDYGVTLEELMNNYLVWMAACPEEFRAWVEQNMMERGTENDN
jgi:hypothetical protein